ncbi:hypothetical protein [Microbacterium sp. A1-JK]|uniref:hypothetical protein n=1 Tax=Microbacterium sp. A1-JK TaxID=3177516 RepID=UPI003889DC3B
MAAGLPWVRMDSDLWANPKVAVFIAAHGQRGLAAMAVWHFAVEFCGMHSTDGLIETPVMRLIHGTPQMARLLVEAGFLDVDEKGWRVKGYANHQPTRDTVEAAAQARSEHARRAANARWNGDA